MKVELNEKETNLILKGLGELPAKESIELIIKLRMNWDEQEVQKSEEQPVS